MYLIALIEFLDMFVDNLLLLDLPDNLLEDNVETCDLREAILWATFPDAVVVIDGATDTAGTTDRDVDGGTTAVAAAGAVVDGNKIL